MILVVDASVAIKWIVNEPGCDEARRYLSVWQGSSLEVEHILTAPALIELEVHNVLAKRLNRGDIAMALFSESNYILRAHLEITDINRALTEVARRMSIGARAAIAHVEGKSRPQFVPFNIYDCIYIAQAKLSGAGLLTADVVQADTAKALGVNTILIAT